MRLTLKTDDGASIDVSYNGVILSTQAARNKQMKGEVVTSDDRYCITAPTFRTSHPKYAWLAATQANGKFIERKHGQGSYIKYDDFALK